MTTHLNPYLSCDGSAREATGSYREVLGGEPWMADSAQATP